MGRSTVFVTETYHSLQGEGPFTGRFSFFVRLSGCNLHCDWCDSRFSWDRQSPSWEQPSAIDPMSLADARGNAETVIVTGGEPLLQQAALEPLVRHWCRQGVTVQFETAGTIEPSIGIADAFFVVSPKLANSKMPFSMRIRPKPLRELARLGAHFKFVICDAETDMPQVLDVLRIAFDGAVAMDRVWLMAEGTNAEVLRAKEPAVAKLALEYGCNFSPRLHVHIFGNKRGT